MRTTWRVVWLWLCGVIIGPLFEWLHPFTWQGATPGWSPKASTEAVEGPAAWDVQGWLSTSQGTTHTALRDIEETFRDGMDNLLAMVYAWRDAEVPA
jgi:hypothetical protein